MSTAVSEPPVTEPEYEHDPSIPDVSLLEDKMPDWFRTPKHACGFTLLVGVVYWFFAMLPIWHTDVWGHLSYGRHIWEAKSLPATEPLMPLSQGIPFVDTAWLSQLIGFGAHQLAGRAAIKFLFGVSIATCVGLLAWRTFEKTRNSLLSALGAGLFLWVDWYQIQIIRPQVAGLVLFCATLFVLTRRQISNRTMWAVPVGFALWANLHGSFLMGIALLGAYAVGRAVDVWRRTGRFSRAIADARFRRLVVMTELALVGTLLNPYGLSLYDAVISVSSHPNMAGVTEWLPLTFRHPQGQVAAAVMVLLFFLYRVSPRRVSTAEVLTIFGIGLATLSSSRFLVWWAPVVSLHAAIHAGAVWRHWKRTAVEEVPVPRASFWTVVSIGFLWVVFAWSPLGMVAVRVAAGKTVKDTSKYANSVGEHTPNEGLLKYLNAKPPVGQVFNPFEWGDYLQWAGPKGMKLFVTSHAQFISAEIWEDYVNTVELRSGWDTNFDRYGINTVILDDKYHGVIIRRLMDHEDWKVTYRDNQCSVFKRKKPI